MQRTIRQFTIKFTAFLFVWDIIVFFVIRVLPFTREHLIGGLSSPSTIKPTFRLESILTTYGWIIAIGAYLSEVTHGALSNIYVRFGTISAIISVIFWVLITILAGYIFARAYLWVPGAKVHKQPRVQ